MKRNEHLLALREHGLQSWLSRRGKISRTTINMVFSGCRRATLEQAAILEELFAVKCIPLNRWDLLYGVKKGQSLADYITKESRHE